jgi:N6-adenosine-specific RNA methylase IME4
LGLHYVHHWIWDKEVAGTGYWGRDRHELLLIGRRGDVAAPLPGSQPETSIASARASTRQAGLLRRDDRAAVSRRAAAGTVLPQAAPGWDAWGFEAGEAPRANLPT